MKRLSTLALIVLLIEISGCKDTPSPIPPDDAPTAKNEHPLPEAPARPTLPPQDPDPDALHVAKLDFERGDFPAVAAALGPLVTSLTGDTQIRAHGIAMALLSLSAGAEIAEMGKENSEIALTDAARLGDPEVQQYARLAHGAYLVGVMEATEAESDLTVAVNLEGTAQNLARLYLARALLGQAFDEENKLVNPGMLGKAKAQYETVLEHAATEAMQGRAETGLAALAKHRKDRAARCSSAASATRHFLAAEASEYLKEAPQILAKGC